MHSVTAHGRVFHDIESVTLMKIDEISLLLVLEMFVCRVVLRLVGAAAATYWTALHCTSWAESKFWLKNEDFFVCLFLYFFHFFLWDCSARATRINKIRPWASATEQRKNLLYVYKNFFSEISFSTFSTRLNLLCVHVSLSPSSSCCFPGETLLLLFICCCAGLCSAQRKRGFREWWAQHEMLLSLFPLIPPSRSSHWRVPSPTHN